jgi:uncharacterized delta-60 repeat protein
MIPNISPTPSNTASNTPTITPSSTSCPYICCLPSGFTTTTPIISNLFLADDNTILIGGGGLGSYAGNIDFSAQILRIDSCGNFQQFYRSPGTTGAQATTGGFAKQSNGKIIVAGNNTLWRLNADYTVDTTFTSGFTDINSSIRGVEVNSQDEILIVGNFTNYTTFSGTSTFNTNIYKLSINGVPDTSYSGKSLTWIDPNIEPFDNQIKKDPNGKLMIDGFNAVNGNTNYAGIVRFNDDFSLDTTFNAAGFIGIGRFVYTSRPLINGQYLVGGGFDNYSGFSNQDFLIRLNNNGTIDTTFSFGSTVFNQYVFGIAVQSTGKIVIADRYSSVIRLNSNGSVDNTFLSGTTTTSGAYNETSLMLFPNDSILFGGSFDTYNSLPYPKLVKLDEDGELNMCNLPTPTPTPSMTSTPAITPSMTSTQTQTPSMTQTTTPSPTFCYEPKAYMLYDANSGRTSLSSWMVSLGAGPTQFKGMNSVGVLSTSQPLFEKQMNDYISYTGYGITTFSLYNEVITPNEDPIEINDFTNTWSDTIVWVNMIVPVCPLCDNGTYTYMNITSGSDFLASSTYKNMVFYYSGTNIQQGYYRLYTSFTSPSGRANNSNSEYILNTLVCPSTPTPTITTTQTSTPTITPTQTLTPTCGTYTTQYMEVDLGGCSNFQLTLFDNPDFTGNANAICDYVVSGCAYGDLGTVYCGTETIAYNDHNHTFNLNAVLQPGECVTGFTVNSVVPACPCVNVIFNQITPTPTATPTITPTQTNTGTLTNTPTTTSTPTRTPEITPSMTQTNTPTPSPTLTATTANLDITNGSLDISISEVYVNAVLTSVVGGTMPNTTGNGTGLSTTQVGVYDVVIFYSAGVAGQKITLTDSDNVSTCQNTLTGGNSMTFFSVKVATYQNVLIEAADGTC